MKITIVTVCMNCEKEIVSTINSVISQTYSDFEYIIIDGASKDNTVQIATKLTEEKSNVRIISEKDKGIYDAMNKAIKLSKGEYIFFLNAGDYFVDNMVLENVANYLKTNKDIYYGNIRKNNIIEHYPSRLAKFYLVYREKMICHQAIFTKKEILNEYPFDYITFKICADRDWLIKVKEKGATSEYMSNILIANYDCNGVSSSNDKVQKESIEIAKKYGGTFTIIFIKIKRFLGKYLKNKIRRY